MTYYEVLHNDRRMIIKNTRAGAKAVAYDLINVKGLRSEDIEVREVRV